ncbi:MAG TPA: cyanophycin synthetase, partial [Thermodesulfovibrionales bacterium]|nr:cyanophycin synthetase [Thermodesulfovibrionales bacterium]
FFLMEGISQRAGKGGPKIITFGIAADADVRAEDIVPEERRSVFNLCIGNDRCAGVSLNVSGRANIYNALAAAAVCSALGAGIADIKKGIESFVGMPMRLEIKELFGATVISDVYNANPASMEEAVRELVRLKKNRAIAVLGDMLELGTYAEEAHRKLGKWMSNLSVDFFIAVGPMMAKAAEEFSSNNGVGRKRVIVAANSSEAGRELLEACNAGDTVLIKGSRGMHMEKVLEEGRGNPSDVPARGGNAL